MSLYSTVHGQNAAGPLLVHILKMRQDFDEGRYRDAWVEHEGDALIIRVHTRNGGGNREDYDDGSMQEHPWYLRDADDDFDSTYADFWFTADPEWIVQNWEAPEGDIATTGKDIAELLVILAQPPVDMGERWRAAIKAIGGASDA